MRSFILPIAQTLFIGVILGSFYAISLVGEQFILRAEPYDPFNPFYGEYVLLQYPDLKATDSLKNGNVYFTLQEGEDGYAVIQQIDNTHFYGAIKGTLYDGRITAPQLEQYYVEQGVGPNLEVAKNLSVTLDVAPWGAIRPVYLEKR